MAERHFIAVMFCFLVDETSVCRDIATRYGLCGLDFVSSMIALYVLAFVPLLLCLNWASFTVVSACVPTLIYCAIWAPHHARHAIALAFTATNVANLLPVGKGIAWNHWPTLIESTRLAAAPENLQNTVWWLVLLLLSTGLILTLTGRAVVHDAQARTQQHGDRGRDEAESRRRRCVRSGR